MMRGFVSFVLATVVITATGNPIDFVCSKYSSDGTGLCSSSKTKDHRLRLNQLGEDLQEYLKKKAGIEKADFETTVGCIFCEGAVDTIRLEIARNKSNEQIGEEIAEMCYVFQIQSETVCDGIGKLYGVQIAQILRHFDLEPQECCRFLLNNECATKDLPAWEVSLTGVPKPEVKPVEPPPDDGPILKVLHISDPHIDRAYTEGAKVQCGDPLCCRLGNGQASGEESAAGKYGDYMCDAPEILLDSMLEHASNTHKDIAYIVLTGDFIAHAVWEQTQENALWGIYKTVEKLLQYFPNVPVYPAIGNHDSSPVNSFPQPGADWSISWLYDELEKQWKVWLSGSESETIRKGAFYSTLQRPGLRIISLNTNYCLTENWWLALDSIDPAQQLQWLVDALQKAEDAKEKVHLIAHISPGIRNNCLLPWKKNFYKVLKRYESTIAAGFYGHTHHDEFGIFYDLENNTRPMSVGYIGPSLTTFTKINPAYRTYQIDGDRSDTTRMVVDHETWVMDLESSNENKEPKWYKSYSAKEEYGLPSLLPSEWHNYYERLKADNNAMELYYQHYTKDSPVRGNCDEACVESRLCAIRDCELFGKPF